MSKRSYSLDVLKVLASVAIVFHHYQIITGAVFRYNFNSGWFHWDHCVELFFMLSGYFIYKYAAPIYRGEHRLDRWFARRWLRIAPVMAISAVVFEIELLVYFRRFGDYWMGLDVSLWGTFVAMIGMQDIGVFTNPCVNNPTWFLSVLLLCYLVFYAVTRFAGRRRINPVYFYIGLALLGICITRMGWEYPLLQTQTARGYKAFFSGVILARLLSREGELRRTAQWVSAAVLAGFILLVIFDRERMTPELQNIMTFIVFPAIIAVMESKPMRAVFSAKLWGTLSRVSFDVYLWHVPIIIVWGYVLRAKEIYIDYSNWLYMLLFLGIVEVCAFISYCVLEKPIGRLTDGWMAKWK